MSGVLVENAGQRRGVALNRSYLIMDLRQESGTIDLEKLLWM
jgi:hypothetical protein